jgi:hypothetical protein
MIKQLIATLLIFLGGYCFYLLTKSIDDEKKFIIKFIFFTFGLLLTFAGVFKIFFPKELLFNTTAGVDGIELITASAVIIIGFYFINQKKE